MEAHDLDAVVAAILAAGQGNSSKPNDIIDKYRNVLAELRKTGGANHPTEVTSDSFKII